MTTWEPELAGDRPPLKPGHAWMTRRRWDAYFLTGTFGVILCIGLGWYLPVKAWWAEVATLGMMVFSWLSIRWQCPREGTALPAVGDDTPNTAPLLIWFMIWVFVGFFGLVLLEGLSYSPLMKEVLWAYWPGLTLIGYVIAWFAGLWLGISRIKRRFKKPRPAGPGGLD